MRLLLSGGGYFKPEVVFQQNSNPMAVMKVIEIMSDSKTSFEDAISTGVERASKSVNNIKSAYVQNQTVTVKNGKVRTYRVQLKLTFEVAE